MAQSALHTSMPIEIVESIALWLTTELKTDYPCARDFISYEHEHERESQKRDCMAMRLVCQAFAHLHTVNTRLFSIHHLYPDIGSLQRLEKLSEHSNLRGHVKHVVFMHPQFPESGLDIVNYERQLRHWLTLAYAEKLDNGKMICMRGFNSWHRDLPLDIVDLERSPIDPGQRDPDDTFSHPHAFYLAKKYFDSVFPVHRRMQLCAEIQDVIQKQQRLLDDGIYAQIGARSFTGLPNATSISICGGNGALSGTVLGSIGGMRSSFLQKRYPQFGVFDVHTYDTHPIATNSFLPIVLELLALSAVSFTHLYLTHMMELSPRHSLPRSLGPQQFSRLRVAHLILKDQDHMIWTAGSWNSIIIPILAHGSDSLEDIYLENRVRFRLSLPDETPHASLDHVLEMYFPSLRRLKIIGDLDMKAGDIANFLTRHQSLKEFSMPVEETVSRTNVWWRLVYNALRAHPGLVVKTPQWRFPGDYQYCCSFSERGDLTSSENPPQWYRDLSDYLYGKSSWTLALEEQFGKMEPNK